MKGSVYVVAFTIELSLEDIIIFVSFFTYSQNVFPINHAEFLQSHIHFEQFAAHFSIPFGSHFFIMGMTLASKAVGWQ
jgi:hypothetical protein